MACEISIDLDQAIAMALFTSVPLITLSCPNAGRSTRTPPMPSRSPESLGPASRSDPEKTDLCNLSRPFPLGCSLYPRRYEIDEVYKSTILAFPLVSGGPGCGCFEGGSRLNLVCGYRWVLKGWMIIFSLLDYSYNCTI